MSFQGSPPKDFVVLTTCGNECRKSNGLQDGFKSSHSGNSHRQRVRYGSAALGKTPTHDPLLAEASNLIPALWS